MRDPFHNIILTLDIKGKYFLGDMRAYVVKIIHPHTASKYNDQGKPIMKDPRGRSVTH